MPFPVHVVSNGNIRDGLVRCARGEHWASIQAFTRSASGKIGMIRRQCTTEYKIVPIRRKVREMVGIAGKHSPKHPVVEQWLGISFDEIVRLKMSMEPWRRMREEDPESWDDAVAIDRLTRPSSNCAVRFSCTVPACRSMMPTSTHWRTKDSSISSLMNATACVACSAVSPFHLFRCWPFPISGGGLFPMTGRQACNGSAPPVAADHS
ncbi:hypothetical protein [Ruegeria sp.]|uniref:hypothetical protein n=1 Tax=Ruegeria sp. TaxID=1879320 RepID=UPI003B004F95